MKYKPDFTKILPNRFITMSMADRYMAVCFIYDGVQYQDLCKEQNPDGTFNYSEKCLSNLPFKLPFISQETQTSSNDSEQGLIKYSESYQENFPDLSSSIYHYKFEVFLLCLFSALLFHLAMIICRRYKLVSSLKYYIGRLVGHDDLQHYSAPSYLAGPTIDQDGKISIGKISFKRDSVLGYGSKGTCVFQGSFEESQKCAVKRIVGQYLNLADREVDFLRSLQNPNLVRYLATEKDAQFIYIAIELAEFSLANVVESGKISMLGLSKVELCRQPAMGLDYLHKLDIVHRDIKPHNILISSKMKGTHERKVMISDFGLSKQLGDKDTCQTSSAMRSFDGTQGWMAPEIMKAQLDQVKSLLPTKSADVFSLGCVFYYVISEGKHPFGSISHRQANIMSNDSVFESFTNKFKDEKQINYPQDTAAMAFELIKTMIKPEPSERPPMTTILKYPFFWSRYDQLQFLQDVSDKIESDGGIARANVERNRQRVIAYGWEDSISDLIKAEMNVRRTYNQKSLKDLLRLIRNKRHHYSELPQVVKESLGELPDGFMSYFSTRFPDLIPHVYHAMQYCKQDPIFKSYYAPSDTFTF